MVLAFDLEGPALRLSIPGPESAHPEGMELAPLEVGTRRVRGSAAHGRTLGLPTLDPRPPYLFTRRHSRVLLSGLIVLLSELQGLEVEGRIGFYRRTTFLELRGSVQLR